MVTDLYGVLWLRNRVRFPELMRVSGFTEKFIWVGWELMVTAGICLTTSHCCKIPENSDQSERRDYRAKVDSQSNTSS